MEAWEAAMERAREASLKREAESNAARPPVSRFCVEFEATDEEARSIAKFASWHASSKVKLRRARA